MKEWKDMTNQEKTEAFNTYLQVETVKNAFVNDVVFCKEIKLKFYDFKNESYRDYIILYLLDKKYTIRDGFKFFDIGSILISDTDIYGLMAEKLDISFEQVFGFYFAALKTGSENLFAIEINRIKSEAAKLSEDLRTRMEIFVEVHNLEYQKENPEKYIELLNSPLTSLLSIKLSSNEKINRILKERILKSKKK